MRLKGGGRERGKERERWGREGWKGRREGGGERERDLFSPTRFC